MFPIVFPNHIKFIQRHIGGTFFVSLPSGSSRGMTNDVAIFVVELTHGIAIKTSGRHKIQVAVLVVTSLKDTGRWIPNIFGLYGRDQLFDAGRCRLDGVVFLHGGLSIIELVIQTKQAYAGHHQDAEHNKDTRHDFGIFLFVVIVVIVVVLASVVAVCLMYTTVIVIASQ